MALSIDHDSSANSIHSLLQELDFPVSLEECRNPTPDFVIRMISCFFQRFHIDVVTITKLTSDQITVLSLVGPDNAGVVSHINLCQAMDVVGSNIFLRDFSLSDITCPGAKRTRKNLKLIANFSLYARETLMDMQTRMNEVLGRAPIINDRKKKHQEFIEAINKKAIETAKNKQNNERMTREIEEILKNKMKSRKEGVNKLEKQCKLTELNKQKILERNQEKRAEVKKLEQITEQSKAQVVKEPQSYQRYLKELDEDCRNKKDQRTAINNAIQERQLLQQNLSNAKELVERQHSKLPEVIKLHTELLELDKVEESLKRQNKETTHSINNEANFDHLVKEKMIQEEFEKCEDQCEQSLSELRILETKLASEKKTLQTQLANMEKQRSNVSSERDQICGTITQVDHSISEFVKECQDNYNKKIKDALKLHDFIGSQIDSMASRITEEID